MIKSVLQLSFPRDHVFDVLAGVGEYYKWFPGCTRSAVVVREGNRTVVETTIEGMKTVTMEVRFEEDPGQSVRFHMTKSNTLKTYAGEHRLLDSADGQGTVIITEVEVDVGALIPNFMLEHVVRKTLDEIGQCLIERVKANFASGAAAGSKRADPRKRRRRILQIANTPDGPRIWYLGKIYGGK